MTETFPPEWLALREPVDHRSRSTELLPPLQSWWTDGGRSSVLDLGCGTGSNLRYLSPLLAGPQRWALVDHDADLLERIHAPATHVELRTVHADLTDALPEVARADLVTASALLDLVSEAWLTRLVDACASSGVGVLLALNYDGSVDWHGPADPVDHLVRQAVNAHQEGDKGLGAALGPNAAPTAEALLRQRGFRTRLAPSPWRLGPDDIDLVRPLIDGWVGAASEQVPEREDEIRDWGERRASSVASGEVGLSVGHQDLLALPSPGRRAT